MESVLTAHSEKLAGTEDGWQGSTLSEDVVLQQKLNPHNHPRTHVHQGTDSFKQLRGLHFFTYGFCLSDGGLVLKKPASLYFVEAVFEVLSLLQIVARLIIF